MSASETTTIQLRPKSWLRPAQAGRGPQPAIAASHARSRSTGRRVHSTTSQVIRRSCCRVRSAAPLQLPSTMRAKTGTARRRGPALCACRSSAVAHLVEELGRSRAIQRSKPVLDGCCRKTSAAAPNASPSDTTFCPRPTSRSTLIPRATRDGRGSNGAERLYGRPSRSLRSARSAKTLKVEARAREPAQRHPPCLCNSPSRLPAQGQSPSS